MMEFAVKEQHNSLNKILFYVFAYCIKANSPNVQGKFGVQFFPISGLPTTKSLPLTAGGDKMMEAQWETF